MGWVLWVTVALPAAGAVAARAAGRRSGAVAAAAAALAAVPAWALLIGASTGERARSDLTWLPAANLTVGLRLDPLSAVMSATVATAGALVLLHAAGYFARERRAPSARAGLLAFLAVMQGLVLADGFLALIVFWELVGALSARLIAFNREDPAAPGGAVRAFLTTRGADVGFYLALIGLWGGAGTLAFGTARPGGAFGVLVGLGLLAAAMGKSAQAPLQTWLSGAMAGPTPVSALLHSATMVAAGVYLLVRAGDTLAGWPLEVAGWVGALTTVAGAAIALGQGDLKRVLAGSTTSQLGLMFVGAAAGGPAVAIFHLIAHAAGKAGMFLATGIFQHARGGTALERLRGAGRDDRRAFAAFAAGALSIAGVVPFAAFWSKDAIVVAAEEHPAWMVLVLLGAAGSAAYLLRPALVLFDRGGATGQESRAPAGRGPMLAAAGALGAGSLGLGLAGAPLADLLGAELPAPSVLSVALALAAVAAGAGLVLARPRLPAAAREAARRQLYGEELLAVTVQRPLLAGARAAAALDTRVVDAAVDATGSGTLAVARSQRWVEERGVDAAVDGLAAAVGRGGSGLQRLQSGRLYRYLRDTVIGVAAVATIVTLTTYL